MRERPSPNWDERPSSTSVDHLILHYTGMQSAQAALDRLCDVAARVSAHYVVEEDGTVWRLVDERARAWHAGVSAWRGQHGLNDHSVGIEIVNPGHEWGYRDFPALQMAAVCELCLGVLARHPIPPRNVVAHSDVAPDRKQDPGELFDWRGMAANGVGLWADVGGEDVTPSEAEVRPALSRLGYGEAPLGLVLSAFQRHWRPEAVTGRVDAGTVSRLQAVLALAEP